MANTVSSSLIQHQLGQESSVGTGTTAGTSLRSLKIEPGRELTVREVMAQGRRFDSTTVLDKQWASFAVMQDVLDYTEHLYCLENIFGHSAVTTPGTATQKRSYDVALTGAITPKTWFHQWGDPTDNVNSYNYGLLTDYGETWDREAGAKQNGTKGIAQVLATGGTFTASPITLANAPIAAKDFNVYLDTTWAGLGGTQISDEITMVDWSITGMKDARWAADRSQASFKSHVELLPKTSCKLTLFENATSRAIIASLLTGSTYFLRLDGQGALIDNYQTLTISGVPTGGTFTLTYKGQTTGAIAYNALASAVQTALVALTTVGSGNATVSGSAGGPYTATFAGTLANDSTLLTHTDSFTGGSSPALAIAQTALAYMARRDLAFRVTSIAALKDTKGVYGRDVTGVIVEDQTGGHSAVLTSQTKEATL